MGARPTPSQRPRRACDFQSVFDSPACRRAHFLCALRIFCIEAQIRAERTRQCELLWRDVRSDDQASLERARTQLAYGERLRRDRLKTEARIQLRNALDTFYGIGARLWAERARDELHATGETVNRRDNSTLETLTPQERRVARLVADGASNKDVAAQLFLSSRTVEYHLGKVFTKLGVASRVELARLPLEPALTGQNA